jgi:hypothetical protein
MRLTQPAIIVSTLVIATLTTVTTVSAAARPVAPVHTGTAGQDSTGESISDLRQEIDRLRLELAKKQADLDAALQRIKALENAVSGSTSAPSPATATAPAKSAAPTKSTATSPPVNTLPPAPMPAPIPADPTIGPGGLMASLQADYLGAFPTVPNANETKQLGLHLRDLENWCVKANRDGTKQYIWVGRIDPNTIRVSGKSVSFVATFVNSNKQFTVPITVDQSLLSRVKTRNGIDTGDLAFSGIVRPRLRVNSARPAPSAFETPYMLAPYLEYFFAFNVKSIVPAAAPSR